MQRKRTLTLREIAITGGLILAILWLTHLVYGIFHKEEVARQAVNNTRAELATLDQRKETLAATVNGLDTDRGKDASLREAYGVAKPGEDVIIVVPKKDALPPPPPTFWEKVRAFFHL